MIYKEKPKEFSPRFEVVSCYVECDGKILLLCRPEHKSEGGKWGVPAGKIEGDEKPLIALLREVKEETNLELDQHGCDFLTSIYVRHSDYDFVHHMYKIKLEIMPDVKINQAEHKDYRWEEPQNAVTTLDLVTDLDECIRMYY